jgi:hypothetical protein
MKRSEMVKRIADFIKYWEGHPRKDVIADALLNMQEDAGMQPPLVKRCPVLHTDSHVWEDEDA